MNIHTNRKIGKWIKAIQYAEFAEQIILRMKSIPNNNQQKYCGFVKHPFVISVRWTLKTSLFQISLIEFCAENFTLLNKKFKTKNT
jgi:hypothetical protein